MNRKKGFEVFCRLCQWLYSAACPARHSRLPSREPRHKGRGFRISHGHTTRLLDRHYAFGRDAEAFDNTGISGLQRAFFFSRIG